MPGDPIIGYITRGRGATIHRRDCPNMLRIRDKERLVQVSWGQARETYPVSVRIRAYDRDGLMRDVSTLVANEGISMSSIHVSTKSSLAIFDLVMGVTDLTQLSRVLNRLEALPNVLEARRSTARLGPSPAERRVWCVQSRADAHSHIEESLNSSTQVAPRASFLPGCRAAAVPDGLGERALRSRNVLPAGVGSNP